MTVYDKLKKINDTNRYEVLNELTPEELRSAGIDGWSFIFDELKKLNIDTIEEERSKRELMRKIYPHYDLPHAKKKQEEESVRDLFTQLSKSTVFKAAACRWEDTLSMKRVFLIEPVVVETAKIMNLSLTRLENYKEDSRTFGYVTRADNSNVFHLNTHPKAFEAQSFSDVMGTLCHELTHLRQQKEEDEISEYIQDGTPLEIISRNLSSLAPHFMAPYFSYTPQNLEQLRAVGYQWDSHQDFVAYTSHPKEKEAFFRGSIMGKLVQSAMDNGYSRDLMPNPYISISETEIDPSTVLLGGFTEDSNPEKHLAAGTALLQKALKKQLWGQSLTQAVSDGFRHYAACLKYGEYLTPSPAADMLSLFGYYARQKNIMNALEQSGYKKIVSDILEASKKSRNQQVSDKARRVEYLISNVPIERYQSKPKEQPQRKGNLRELLKTSQNQENASPMDKHNAIDYRNVGGKERPVEPPNIPIDSQEEIRRHKQEEIYRQLTDSLSNKL